MEVFIDRKFEKDCDKLKGQPELKKLPDIIRQVEQASKPSEIKHLRPIKGTSNYYRIKAGAYRIGLIIKGPIVEFIRILHRKDVYRYFP